MQKAAKIAVIGLGYVGLPLLSAFSKHFSVIGYDVDDRHIGDLRNGIDRRNMLSSSAVEALLSTHVTSEVSELRGANVFVITVPTPVGPENKPDLEPLLNACDVVAAVIEAGALVIIESTVYPGVTENICGPRIESRCGLSSKKDFKLAYSPERINPGDSSRGLDNVVKVISAQDDDALERVSAIYSKVVKAGVFKASSIGVAEAAKVFENVQRDVNIAAVNELARICDALAISTKEVLSAAATKWNFLGFSPGLVGGHCIGVDPYYLAAKSISAGYVPKLILSTRELNESMVEFVSDKIVNLLNLKKIAKFCRIGVLGMTFKENVNDLRNSKTIEVINNLTAHDIEVVVCDPVVDASLAGNLIQAPLVNLEELRDLDALLVMVPHDEFRQIGIGELLRKVRNDGLFVDIKGIFDSGLLPEGMTYWSL
ncbi:nucleotide sugar dehydrogenase [Rhizobium laguerreae]|uniref:nucleotide sugar dehydrogenase n=1 Tax=Rhizobium laguerreae TaxID=1076926 RepID=UPI001C90FBF0|nr:nucleotide sugar dehydrogenase [Rhizobium laguerreae]MBY3561755.1 nucleotide sugar dehydrogenase [Rhizobium laguerreae]